MWICILTTLVSLLRCQCVYAYLREASAPLLVLLIRAIPEPQRVGASNKYGSHAFLQSICRCGGPEADESMKNSYKFFAMGLVSLMGVSFASCSDDDDPKGPENVEGPSVENVFTEGLPSNVDGATFTTNEKGQLTKIVDGTTSITFEYGSFNPSRASNFTVLMKERDSAYPTEGSDIYMQINKQGFVSYAYQVYLDGDDADEWWFEYNKDGQLTRLKRTESGDDFKIAYTNGDIAKIAHDEDDGDHREYTINYTNTEYKNVVANKGCLMLFDDFFQVDMDEMGDAYFAGLLGKATKNLPMGYSETGKEGSSSYTSNVTYHWVFNADNLPVKFWEGDYENEATTFSWK